MNQDKENKRKKANEYMRKWNAKNKTKVNNKRKNNYSADQEKRDKSKARALKWYYKNKEKILADRKKKQVNHTSQARRLRIKWKKNLYEILGNKCCRCGFSDERALQIDHINGGGCHIQMERNKRCTYSYYRMLALNKDTPKHFQLLCANCNWIKRYENNEINQHKV
jgi:hypothetical protein